MSRGRGNKRSKAAIEDRRLRLTEALREGKPQAAITEELGISRQTLYRDLEALTKRFLEAINTEDVRALKKVQVEARQKTAGAVLEGTVPPDVSNAWAKLQDGIERILGLNAESRAIVAHVSASTDTTVLEFRKHADGLTGDDLQKVWAFMDSLPRTPQATVRDASWYPEPEPKLLEGQ